MKGSLHGTGAGVARARSESGFTLLELMILIVILSIIAALAIPAYEDALLQARQVRAIADLRALEKDVISYEARHGALPATLDEARPDPPLDPWGQPYVYFRFPAGSKHNVKGARADKNLRPVNSSFDLYSIGEDGDTSLNFTAKKARDDIVRAADGAYFGRAEGY